MTICTVTTSKVGHSLGDWIIDAVATCTTEGKKHRCCTMCGEVLKTVTYPKTKHTPGEWIIDTDAACTEDGLKHTECTVCGQTLETQIIKGGHAWGEWKTDTEATCTSAGSRHRQCSVCGEIQTETTSKLHHSPGEWQTSKESTCTENGEQFRVCTVCGTLLVTRDVEKLNHVDADSDGYCDNCSQTLDRNPSEETPCDHICHKSGFAGFIWKIINLFNKLFKINQHCSCGKLHW